MSGLRRACGGVQGNGSGTQLPEFIDGLCNYGEAGADLPARVCRLPQGHDGDHDLREVQR